MPKHPGLRHSAGTVRYHQWRRDGRGHYRRGRWGPRLRPLPQQRRPDACECSPDASGGRRHGASADGICTVNLVNWEQVGGIGWRTPTFGSGQVTIGSVPTGQYIESSNPPVVDAQTLAWNLDGPADVSYTLFDSNSQSSHELWLFLAGITAALGATLLVELVKGSSEISWLQRHRGHEPGAAESTTRPVPPPRDPTVNARERARQWPAFLVGVLSGVLASKLSRRRDE
jgi:hypothetical protein